MALDKVIDSAQLDADLTAVADAIRTKGGTSEALSFPDGFVSAVEGIQAGGGGVNEQEIIDALAVGTFPSGDVVLNASGDFRFPNYAFFANSGITSLTMPYCTIVRGDNVFGASSGLTKVSFPVLTEVAGKLFVNCSKLVDVSFPELVKLNKDQAIENTGIERVVFPKVISTYNNAMRYNKKLQYLEFGKSPSFATNVFNGCSVLSTVVIRGNTVASLSNISAFANTPLASGGSGGTVYVPSALIPQYQQATNWSTLYAAGTCNFVAIEGSEYE